MDVAGSDLLTVAVLVALEGLLSADNAMVLAVLVLGLPRHEQRKALRYGIAGAFVFRILAIMLAVYLIEVRIVMLIGAAYLLWLPYNHFTAYESLEGRRTPPKARAWLGMTAFWATVVRVELTDIVFAIDSILVAVAMSDKLWVIITGGVLGVITMRLVIGQLLVLVNRYPPLVDGAFVIIAWVGIKLVVEYLHEEGYIGFGIPQWLSLGLIVVIFAAALAWARWTGPVEADPLAEHAEDMLVEDGQEILAGEPDDDGKRG